MTNPFDTIREALEFLAELDAEDSENALKALSDLRAIVDKKDEALKPFAEVANCVVRMDDEIGLWARQSNYSPTISITVGDIRKAKEAMALTTKGEKK